MSPRAAVRRVVFREFRPTDAASAQGASNSDPSTGGGARDLRYPHEEVGPIISQMFSGRRTLDRRRGGTRIQVQAPTTKLHYTERSTGATKSVEIVYEDPTDTRPNMGRITNTPSIPPIAEGPDAGRGVAFAFITENAAGEVWFDWAYEDDLRAGLWHESVADPLIACLDDPERRPNKVCVGYIDLVAGRTYCHH